MSFKGIPYLVTVDRLTGWADVQRAKHSESGGAGLVKILRNLFITFGIPEELASDGGPEFVSGEVQKFLSRYGVRHRLSSVGNPHSNQRAEVGIKSMKRLLKGNLNASGTLDDDAFAKAILQYRNTPMQSTGMSPAVALFGHPIRDFIPMTRDTYKPSVQWIKKLAEREEKWKKVVKREHRKWSQGARKQEPLKVGHEVSIQNLVGNHPTKWNRTGLVTEVLGNDQYNVRVDWSGRITLRNRKHLKPIGYRKPADPFPQLLSPKQLIPKMATGEEKEKGYSSQPIPMEVSRDVSEAPDIAADQPMGFGRPNDASTPRYLDADKSCRSDVFMTPLRTPTRQLAFSPSPARDTPTPAKSTPTPILPRKSTSEAPSIHPELRSHNRPGLKEVPVDVRAPRQTRSGNILG